MKVPTATWDSICLLMHRNQAQWTTLSV